MKHGLTIGSIGVINLWCFHRKHETVLSASQLQGSDRSAETMICLTVNRIPFYISSPFNHRLSRQSQDH
jgi:hypothetical protein